MKDKQESNGEVKISTHVIHSLAPPLLCLSSDFKSIGEWLSSMCLGDRPKQSIDTYSFGLSESPKEYILSLVGENTYKEEENYSVTKIEFKPTTMYFKLPDSEYKTLSRHQVLTKLIFELQEFLKTEQFQTSFFTEANSIRFRGNGQILWSKR
jgi:hypothetical protein